uniref:Genome polyprotein n=1 Tax=Picornavirales sp. TaxID=1955153 RepID=A0A6M9Z7B4_9VIRU|nr:MAG: polyprotein [Picornavirales sp.]
MEKRSSCVIPSVNVLVEAIRLALKNATTPRPYTVAICNWLNGLDYYYLRKEESKEAGGTFHFCYGIRLSLPREDGGHLLIEMKEETRATEKKMAAEEIYLLFCRRILRPYLKCSFEEFLTSSDTIFATAMYVGPRVYPKPYPLGVTQMDADSGVSGQEVVDRESNVIMHVEEQADETKVLEVSSNDITKALSSTEKPFDMVGDGYSIMNRWYPLQQVTISEATKSIFSLRIPEALYADQSSVNLLPLRGFVYGDLDLEFKLVVNAAPFHAGRLIMGIFYCPQSYNEKFQLVLGINTISNNYDYYYSERETQISSFYGMVQRPHVLLDFAESTTGSMIVKYNYNKPYVRLLDFSTSNQVNPGVLGGYFVNLRAEMITPLKTGDDNPKYVNCTLFYRFIKAKLTGMTSQHALRTQMDILGSTLAATKIGSEIVGTGVNIINSIERQLTRKGIRTSNRDKPSMQFSNIPITPKARNHFPNGVGLADCTIMGMDVKSLTTHFEDSGEGPKSYLEYAKIPGISQVINWGDQQATGVIFMEKVQPYEQYVETQFASDGSSNLTVSSPLPLHIASNGFMYWAGTIVYEFDFVKTAFHKGLLMISLSFGKVSDSSIGSNYEKIVDIQQTSRIKITVPYIYDTVARRTLNNSVLTTWPQPADWSFDSLPTFNQTQIKLTVMNPLISTGTVANNIDIVVWKYGGPDFFLGSLCQVNNTIAFNATESVPYTLQTFPARAVLSRLSTATHYRDNLPNQGAAGSTGRTQMLMGLTSHKQINKSIIDMGRTQIDENDFQSGIIEPERFHTGDCTNFKNILRTPIRIVVNEHIKAATSLNIPVVPLTVEFLRSYCQDYTRLAMTHHSQIVRLHRMWRGTLRYTVVLSSTKPVYITYLPSDGSWKARIASKYFNERVPGVNGKPYDPTVTPIKMNTMYGGKSDLSCTGNYTDIVIPLVNPSESVEVPWNSPVNWALMNQGGVLSQKAFREIGSTNNGHLCFYSDFDFDISIFWSVGDDFEMGAFCGMTDNVNVSKGGRMDDARYKTQMDFQSEECSIDGNLSEYYSCDESKDNIATFINRHKVKLIKPFLMGGSHFLPAPFNAIIQGLVVAHTVGVAEEKFASIANSAAKVQEILTSGTVKNCISGISKVTNQIDKNLLPKTNNILGNCVTISDNIKRVTLPKADRVLEGCTSITDGISSNMARVQSLFEDEDLGTWIGRTFSYLGGEVLKVVENLFKRMYQSILSYDCSSIANYFTETLIYMGLATKNFIVKRLGYFYTLLQRILTNLNPWAKTQMLINQNELDIDLFNACDFQNLIGLLMGGLISVYGISQNTSWQKTFKKDEIRWTNELLSFRTIAGTNTCITFIKNIYSTMSKMMFRIFGIQDEEMSIRYALSNSESVVSEFCKNAQMFLSDFNNEAYGDPVQKSKFWITICNAYQIQASLCKIKGDSATNVLKGLCRDVIKKSNETMSLFKASCVRYEPFVLCLEGESGIGKSFLTSRLSVDILNNLNLKMPSVDFRYNVSPGVEYWNLYNGQPIIIYDDWCNLVDTQSIRKEISELYQLKTSNVMNAPKAELSEKKTVVNPFAVLLATNNPFPKTNTLIDHKPLYRRRDVLVRVQLKENVNRSDPACYDNFGHLEFAIYDNSASDQRSFKYTNFRDFQEEIKRRHSIYHKQESNNVKARLKILSEALTEQALSHMDIDDPFTLQARSLYQTDIKSQEKNVVNSLPSELLNYEVLRLIESIEENFKLVKTTNESFLIEDSLGMSHQKVVAQTQGLSDVLSTIFVTPIMKTWNILYSYLNKWLDLGYHCSICRNSALNSGLILSCSKCNASICGWCARSRPTCDCSGEYKFKAPKFMDLIIGHVVYLATNVLAPQNWRQILMAKLVGWFTNMDMGVPSLFIGFMFKMISYMKESKFLNGPIKVTAKTQMGYAEDLKLPAQYKVVDVKKNGDCLPYSIFQGLQQFNSFKEKVFADFKAKLLKVHPKNSRGWFDTDTHAVAAVRLYGIDIHLIEKHLINKSTVWVDSLITADGIIQMGYYDYFSPHANKCVHIINEGDNHFSSVMIDTKIHVIADPIANLQEEINDNILSTGDEYIEEPTQGDVFYLVERPPKWWYDRVLGDVHDQMHCNHFIENWVGRDIEFEENSFTYHGKTAGLYKCNPDCILNREILEAIINEYFFSNIVKMQEDAALVKRGIKSATDCSIPLMFRPKWMAEQFEKVQKECVAESAWLPWLFGKISDYSVNGFLIFALCYAIKKTSDLCKFFSSQVFSFFFGSTQSETTRGANSNYQRLSKLRKSRVSGKTQAAEVDTQNYRNIKDKISQNYVIFKTDKVKQMIGIGLYGSKVLIPKHYIAPLQESKTIEIQFYHAKHETMFLNPNNLVIQYFTDKDCAIVEVSKAIYFADIRKFFMSREEYNSFRTMKGEILVPKNDVISETGITLVAILDSYEAYDDYTKTVFQTDGAIEYNFEQRGACGSLILTKNQNHPIVGIHIAGHEGMKRGVGARICADNLVGDKFVDFPDLPFDLQEEGLLDFGEEVNVEYLGKVNPEMTPFLPIKTNIEHSMIDEHFQEPNRVEPAILSSKDKRYLFKEASPLIYGVQKHGKPTLDFDTDIVEGAANFVLSTLLTPKWSFSHKVKIYSVKEAALGLKECVDYYDWLPDSTSAGWPYNVIRQDNGPLKTQKKHWMRYIRDKDERPIDVEIDPLILEHIDRDQALRRTGVLAPIVFQDMLKDEKRLIEKLLKKGGTRVFSMSPVNASLVLRQYTLDLTSYLRANRIDNWFAIGINPDGPEWGKLVTRLKTKGENIFSVDYSNFGPGLNIEVAILFKELIKNFYSKHMELVQEEKLVIDSLIGELMYSMHLAGGTIYRTKSGSPSGAAITVEINSFTHFMYVVICWLIIGKIMLLKNKENKSIIDETFLKYYSKVVSYFDGKEIDYKLFDDMHGNVQLFYESVTGVVYGDDGIFSVTDDFCEVFNAKSMSLVLEAHKICATDASKNTDFKPYGLLEDMTFLKRGFVPHPKHRGEWLAPITLVSVEECARWIRRGQPSDQMTIENCKASLLLAYGNGPKYYEVWRQRLNEYLSLEELPKLYITWENIDHMFYKSYYTGTFKDPLLNQLKEELNILYN